MTDTVTVSKDVKHVVGTTPTLIERPAQSTGTDSLVLVADTGDWKFLAGDRRPLTFAPTDVDPASDLITVLGHHYATGDGPFQLAPGATDTDQLPAGLAPQKATGLLTFTGNAANSETITIDGKTYTFQTTLTDVDGNVLIGASLADSRDNLMNAIILGPGAGTTYATSTTLHGTATAQASGTDALAVNAKTEGTAGNAIVTSETSASAAWGATALQGGLDAVNYFTIVADSNHIRLAASRADALAGVTVDITGQGSGTHALDGTANVTTAPTADISDGSGGIKVFEGQSVILPNSGVVTVVGLTAGNVLTYFWSPAADADATVETAA